MPRRSRMYLGDMPYHVIQRGNNREPCFYALEDYQFYLETLSKACQRYHVSIHAYVLMTNHTHLLLTPSDEPGISLVMQSLGRHYVQYINKTYRRTGTLWEGRHKSSLVDADRYLLACYRYIELNPVRAGMVKHPGDHKWSSYRNNALGETNHLIKQHAAYKALGSCMDHQLKNYRGLFDAALDQSDINAIRNAAAFDMPLGDNRFQEKIASMLKRKIDTRAQGRAYGSFHEK